jgi:spore coat polysaccharide biosynthesis protein SpsF (cytidylyltransferase family)
MSRTVAILQARMGSQRLPGKVLRDLCGQPMMARVVTRALRAKTLDLVVVATSALPGDDAVETLCLERGWPVYRGSPDDLLDRYYQAARLHEASTIVRITCDCPMIEPNVIDRTVSVFRDRRADYASNGLPPRTFPRGLDTEAFTVAALERAWREDTNPAWREHVTPYLYRHPELFKLAGLVHDKDYSAMRWTVDTPEDMVFVTKVYEAFGHDRFTWTEVLTLLTKHPEWLEINREILQKEVR